MIIYKVKNKITGKVYIGKTIKGFSTRKNQHINDALRGSTYIFHNALRGYGKDKFEWEILRVVFTHTKLNELEKNYIAEYKSNDKNFGYNMTAGGEGSAGYCPTEETRKKVSESLKGRIPWNKGKSGWNKGFKMSDESKLKMSIAKKGKKLSEEHIKNITKATKGRNNPMYGKHHSAETRRKLSEAIKSFRNNKYKDQLEMFS